MSGGGSHRNGERFTLGAAASAAVIAAACISALPAATCSALSETYARAILDFGGTSICGFLAFLYIQTDGFRTASGAKFALNVFPWLVIGLFGASALASAYNLRAATDFCFSGTTAEQAAHLRQHIPLVTAERFWRIFMLPSHPWD